jgi:hypothetical protein
MTKAGDAYADLLAALEEIAERFAGEEWGITDAVDVAETLRLTMHLLGSGIETQFDDSAARPVFRQIVTPWRKSLGDNADAMYHDAKVHPAGVYRVRGQTGGAVYVSCTVEAGAEDGAFPSGTVGVLNDTEFDVTREGEFTFMLGGPSQARNWLGLTADASRLTIRHYWEQVELAAVPAPDLALHIELVDGDVPLDPRAPTDASIAASIRRVANYVRSRTMGTIPKPGEGDPPAFVSRVPHEFPAPIKPGHHALAAADAAYSMAPYLLGPDEALVITARWPRCRCANVNLWNRQMQTLDYLRHGISLNRAQTVTEADGTFRAVVAHDDPGVANWLDTEGRPFGLVFWRYMLPEGPIETPRAQVVPLASLA